MSMEILFEDKYIIAVNKSAGIPSQPDKTGDESLLSMVGVYLRDNNADSSEVSIINRLDRPVGGVTLFAKDKITAAKLSAMLGNGIEKEYLAVTTGRLAEDEGTMKDYLLKQGKTNTTVISNKGAKNAKEAILKYKFLGSVKTDDYGELFLYKVLLVTGRHHQIRVQFAGRKAPLWGDTKYNNDFKSKRGFFNIALFSHSISFLHPVLKKEKLISKFPENYPFSLFTF